MLASKVISSESRSLLPHTFEILPMLCMIRCLETEQENQLLSMVRRGFTYEGFILLGFNSPIPAMT